MSLVLSFDIGTTSAKAGLVDKTGNLLAQARTEVSIQRPTSGAAEHCPAELFTTLLELGKEVVEGRAQDVSLLIFSSYHFGLIFLDKDFNPLSGMSTLMDTRARRTHEEFGSFFDMGEVYGRTGCPPFFQYGLGRLFYFNKHDYEPLRNAAYLGSSKSYLMYRFTGSFVTEASTESASQFFDIHKQEWMGDFLKEVGASHLGLPEVVHALESSYGVAPDVAKELGLRDSVKVIPGIYDGGAVGVGLGGFQNGTAVINVGTSGMLRAQSNGAFMDAPDKMRFQTYNFFDDQYLPGGGINNATLPMRWLKDNVLACGDYETLLEGVRDVVAGADGLFCLPYLTGERDWQKGTAATGVFFGLRERHRREHIVRACMEGVAYCLTLVGEALAECGVVTENIRIGGGGSQVRLWSEIIASCLNKPLERTGVADSCLIGNAILGFVHLGEYASIADASAAMVRVEERIEPLEELVHTYARLFSFYKDIYRDVDTLYKRHQKLCAELRS